MAKEGLPEDAEVAEIVASANELLEYLRSD